jgi:biotin transport system substrate-specific component
MAYATPQPRVLADVVPATVVNNIALVLGGAAFVGISAQLAVSLPFTPVPLTMQTFAVLAVGAVLGSVRGAVSLAVYALAGMAGVPWFANQTSGFSAPSFGYIVGFIVAAYVVGRLAEGGATRTVWRTAYLMILGSLTIYAIGMTWLKFSLGVDWSTAFELGVAPFLLGDAVKAVAAAGILPLLWRGLTRRGLLE